MTAKLALAEFKMLKICKPFEVITLPNVLYRGG